VEQGQLAAQLEITVRRFRESEQLRLEKIALVQAVDSTKTERDTAQARAALAADEIAAGSETRAALNQSIGIVEQLQSENRRLTTALGVAGREAARLQADSTHYADEVIGLRSRLARVSAAPPEANARNMRTNVNGSIAC